MRLVKKMKCFHCKGSGELSNEPYRQVVQRETEDTNRFNMKKVLRTVMQIMLCASIAAVAIISVGSLLGWMIKGCEQSKVSERHLHQWESKMGYVIAQHGVDNNTIVRCWIVPPRFGTDKNYRYGVAGPDFFFGSSDYTWIEVPDRNDADGFAQRIGITDLSKCIKSGQQAL